VHDQRLRGEEASPGSALSRGVGRPVERELVDSVDGVAVVVEGIVVEGDHRGRALGFPTANLEPGDERGCPAEGVYAGYVVRADGTRSVSAISVGRRPTYYDDRGRLVVEAHLLDFDGDLYGERLSVHIGKFIRGQLRFASVEDLRQKIAEDVAAVRASGVVLGGETP
jgi:riboflavin kinase/FMN adenylyltransferase